MAKDRTPYPVLPADSKNWHIRDGTKLISTRTSDRGEATDALLAYIAKRAAPEAAVTAKADTLGAVLEAWGKMLQERNPKTYDRKWRYLINRIAGQHGHLTLAEINRDWGRRFERSRLRDGVQEPTIRQDLSSIAAAWLYAKDESYTDRDPPRFDLPSASERREAWLTREEAEALIEAAPFPHVRLFIELAISTGGRHEALLQLTWDRVRLDRGTIDLRLVGAGVRGKKKRAKEVELDASGGIVIRRRTDRSKRRAHVPVDGDIIEELRLARERAVTDNVIEFRGKPLKTIRAGFRAAVVAAGFDPDEITPHSLRHSVATWLAQDGVDFWEIAGFLGHKDVRMVIEIYGHHHPDFMAASRDALARRKKETPRP